VPDLTALHVDSPLSYAVAFTLPALDAVVPVLPSETAIIALGAASVGTTDPRLGVLILLAALGAFVGDNLCYLIGRHFKDWTNRRFFAGEKGRHRRDWAESTLARYGGRMILVCRFIPGGRTAVTLTCGATEYPRGRFLVATAVAGTIWAMYAFFLGRLGGEAFKDRPWVGLLLALGVALLVSGAVEGGRRLLRWRRSRTDPQAAAD
jgi:membrane-associated protein